MLGLNFSDVFNNASGGTLSTFVVAAPLAILAQIHCAAMCGPLVSAMTGGSRRGFLVHQAGRVVAYTLLGGTVALISARVGVQLQPHPTLSKLAIVFILATLLLSLVSILKSIFGESFGASFHAHFGSSAIGLSLKKIQAWFSEKGLTLYQKLHLTKALKETKLTRSFLLGLATPLIPCGQLWAVLAFAALRANAEQGALVGFLFAVFTVPGVYSFSWIRNQAASLRTRKKGGLAIRMGVTALLLGLIVFSVSHYAAMLTGAHHASPNPHHFPDNQENLICR
ncbi:MAG: sulfite exporter TauE/SafE family protein [Bdellovibrionales bacterium]|nr:sulfite exporter TauE/SafE family protein [Bdellovibrionales bacterium]